MSMTNHEIYNNERASDTIGVGRICSGKLRPHLLKFVNKPISDGMVPVRALLDRSKSAVECVNSKAT